MGRVKVHSLKRAFGAVMASSIVVAGMGIGLSGAAQAESSGGSQVTSETGLLDLPLPLPDVLPSIGGVGEVDGLLNVLAPVWPLLNPVLDIQWLRDGVPIPGATGPSYIPTLDDAGSQISALVTASLLGFLPLEMITNAIGIPLPGTEATTPAATTPPKIAGPAPGTEAKVGKVLTGTAPVWDTTGVSTAYQWLRAGSPIAGATALTYTVAPEDIGKAISLKATGTKSGGTPGTSTSAPVSGVIGDAPTATTAPAISGTPKVGETLTVTAPVWSLATVVTAYQWQRNGTAIPGATGTTYAVTPADVGAALTAKATGTKTGYTPGSATTTPVTGALGDAPAPTSAPTVLGTPKIGETLTANPGAWGTPEPAFAYQWRRDGVAIPGATSATYTVLAADAAHTLSFAVTATREGYAPGSATSEGVAVTKTASRTQVSLITKTVTKGKKAVLKIILTATGAKPAGNVKVYDGAKLLKGYSVRVADNGVRIVKLPVLKPGKHKIKGVYAGSASVAGSTSKVVTLKVLKKK
jgi:hypothetical protein